MDKFEKIITEIYGAERVPVESLSAASALAKGRFHHVSSGKIGQRKMFDMMTPRTSHRNVLNLQITTCSRIAVPQLVGRCFGVAVPRLCASCVAPGLLIDVRSRVGGPG